MKKYLYAIIAVAVVIVSCQKERPGNNSLARNLNDSLWFDDHGDTLNPDSIPTVLEKEFPISTTCVSLTNGILEFQNSMCFAARMAELVNSSVGVIDTWEATLGHISRRRHWNLKEASNDNYDDALMDSMRLNDMYFESVLDTLNRIIIGDTLYTFNFSNGTTQVMKLMDSSTWTVFNTYSFKNSPYCHNHSNKHGDKKYPNSEFMKSEKFVDWYFVYSSIGIRQDYYKYNWRGKAKKHITDKLTLLIDQWHFVRYEVASGGAPQVELTNLQRSNYLNKEQVWLFSWGAGIGHQGYCVDDFERFHVYKDDYTNDMHHDNW